MMLCLFFFFNDPATTEIYPLPLHDALPICMRRDSSSPAPARATAMLAFAGSSFSGASISLTSGPTLAAARSMRSEEHTSELQSRQYLVCRLLLEKKKNYIHMSKQLHIQRTT